VLVGGEGGDAKEERTAAAGDSKLDEIICFKEGCQRQSLEDGFLRKGKRFR